MNFFRIKKKKKKGRAKKDKRTWGILERQQEID